MPPALREEVAVVAGEVEVVAVVEVEARPRSLPRHEQRGEAAAAVGVVAEVGVGVAENISARYLY